MTNQTQMLRRWNLKHNTVQEQCHNGTGNNATQSIVKLNSMIASKAEDIQNLEEEKTKLINENYNLKEQV